MEKKLRHYFILIICLTVMGLVLNLNDDRNLKIIAIANYGQHTSLEAAIRGFKNQLAKEGFIENKNIRYEIADVGFDSSLIPQMITSLRANKPAVMMVMTTPVAQVAKAKIHDIPLIYNVVTDPVEAGLIKDKNIPDGNVTGSSDQQNLDAALKFAKSILPKAKKVGLLYATSESNDLTLVKMMHKSAETQGMKVLTIPIEQARDVSTRVLMFKGKVDFIYVGSSGPIQPTLPTIAAAAKRMKIPVFNSDTQAVKEGLVLASYGVDYASVGEKAGQLASEVLNHKLISKLRPTYPALKDHHGIINKKLAIDYKISIPNDIEFVE